MQNDKLKDSSMDSSAERDVQCYEKMVVDGIWAGYNNFEAGHVVTREESKKTRQPAN